MFAVEDMGRTSGSYGEGVRLDMPPPLDVSTRPDTRVGHRPAVVVESTRRCVMRVFERLTVMEKY
jgi:hypothetical protein